MPAEESRTHGEDRPPNPTADARAARGRLGAPDRRVVVCASEPSGALPADPDLVFGPLLSARRLVLAYGGVALLYPLMAIAFAAGVFALSGEAGVSDLVGDVAFVVAVSVLALVLLVAFVGTVVTGLRRWRRRPELVDVRAAYTRLDVPAHAEPAVVIEARPLPSPERPAALRALVLAVRAGGETIVSARIGPNLRSRRNVDLPTPGTPVLLRRFPHAWIVIGLPPVERTQDGHGAVG